MINKHYYSVDRKYATLRFCTNALYGVAVLVVLYSLYQLMDAAPKPQKGDIPLDTMMQAAMFEAKKYLFFASLGSSAALCLVAMVIELFLGMEENQRELVELAKIQIDIEDKKAELESSKK